MVFFVSALVAPILGPALYGLLHGRDRAVRALDSFVYVAVPLLVAGQVVPAAYEHRSLTIVLAAAGGVLLPTLFEQASRSLESHTDDLALVVGLSGVVIHALLEGAAFAPWGASVDPVFGTAVALHRIPVALVIWWLLRPRHGPGWAGLGVAALMFATLAGFLIGSEILDPVHGVGFEHYQAFVSGTLVHVVFHRGRHDHAHCGPTEHGPTHRH